jgi:hypothetical protein
MNKLVICAAAFALAAAVSSVPAAADYNYGGIRNGDSCWKEAPTRRGEFGYWDKCATAERASVAIKHARTHKRASHS